MVPRFRRSWRLPMCLCIVSLGLTLLCLGTYKALGQIPPFDSGGAPTVQFAYGEYYVSQNAGSVTIRVTLPSSYSQPVTVDYNTSDGTATAPSYYTSASGTLTFSPGQVNATFQVTINNTGFSQFYTVNLALSNPTNATLGSTNTAFLVIMPPNTMCPPTGSDS